MLCVFCDLPVDAPSMGGSAVCCWCDMGHNRDGTQWDTETALKRYANNMRRMGISEKPELISTLAARIAKPRVI